MHKVTLIVAVPLLLLLSACAGGGDDLRYFPLEAGRFWRFTAGTNRLYVFLEKGEKDGLFLLKGSSGGSVDTMLRLRMENDRLFVLEFEDERSLEAAWIRFPLTKGAQWEFEMRKGALIHIDVLGRERVTVPAGTFDDCVIIQMTLVGDGKEGGAKDVGQIILRLAHDVGLVRIDFVNKEGKKYLPTDPLVLTSYGYEIRGDGKGANGSGKLSASDENGR